MADPGSKERARRARGFGGLSQIFFANLGEFLKNLAKIGGGAHESHDLP